MREATIKNVREALNNLYDPEQLRKSQLVFLLGLSERKDAPSALRHLLEDAIQALRPSAGSAVQSQTRRSYNLLLYRYIEQFSQKEVAEQLGVSVRQYQREQQIALNLLASYLEEKYSLIPATGELLVSEDFPKNLPGSVLATQDLIWMFEPSTEKTCHFSEELDTVLQLIDPLVKRYQVKIVCQIPEDLPALSIHPEALRQVLVPVLSTAIHQTPQGNININIRPREWDLCIVVRSRQASEATVAESDQQGLAIARDILERSGGLLDVRLAEGSSLPIPPAEVDGAQTRMGVNAGFWAQIYLPTLESLPVLVVDDSADNLQLLARYLTNTRYCMVSLSEPENAVEVAESTKPCVIVLDLMMPKIDGWEVLGLLKRFPATAEIPVVVCSILPQEELALELGAEKFLRKPVTREAFLQVLDHCAAGMESKAR